MSSDERVATLAAYSPASIRLYLNCVYFITKNIIYDICKP